MPFLSRYARFLILLLGATFALAGGGTLRSWAATADAVGVNLTPLGTGGGVAFVDAMKEAAPWTSRGALQRDALGNVVSLANGQSAVTVIYPRGGYVAGDYTLLYDGTGTFAVSPASGTVTGRAAGRLTIRVTPHAGYGIHLTLVATDPRNYARNIRLILPGFVMSYGVAPFNPAYTNALRGLGAVRFAGWQRPEPTGNRSWAARTVPASFTQGGPQGVAPEYMIALANAAQLNPWFVLPVDATDEYVSSFARLVARELDPQLHATFEYGDAVWLPGTAANTFAAATGRRLGLAPGAVSAALAWYSLRSVQIFGLVDREFPATAERPGHVLSGPLAQQGTPGALVASAIVRYANAGTDADAYAVPASLSGSSAPNESFATNAFATALSGSASFAAGAHLKLIAYRGGSAGQLTPNLLSTWRAAGGGLFVATALDAASPATAGNALRAAAALSRLSLPEAARAASAPAAAGRAIGVPLAAYTPGTTLLGEAFAGTQTPFRAWSGGPDSCLTAGTSTTPASSLRACNGAAAHDSPGNGALQLTAGPAGRRGFSVYRTPFATSRGLEITYTDYTPAGSRAATGNVTLFLADAAKLMPTAVDAAAGVPKSTYLSVGLGAGEASGALAKTARALVIAGSAAGGSPTLGGSADARGRRAGIAVSVAAPGKTRDPLAAPAIRAILTPEGGLTVALDLHDGRGFMTYAKEQIAGYAGQSSLPGSVFVGFTAATGSAPGRAQIGNLRLATLTPATTFAPGQVGGLAGWYDATNAASVTQTAGAVSAWNDLSGHGDTLAVPATHTPPTYSATALNGLAGIGFDGTKVLAGKNAFSAAMLNESTVFIVGNETPTTLAGDILFSGAYHVASPSWALRPTYVNGSTFAFNTEAGSLTVAQAGSGPTIWSVAGSVSSASRLFRKNGTLMASGAGPVPVTAGSYPLAVGAMFSGGTAASYGYRGQVGEIVVYDRFLAPTETTEVEGYLACKWGLQSRLPANHPYRTTCPGGGTPPPTPAPTQPAAGGGSLPDPAQLRSSGGVLTVNVTAVSDPSTHDPALSYNGAETPPTLRLSPGDTLIVNLTNRLPAPAPGSTFANDVNLHYHGLHVSPNRPADDSIDMVATPGQSVQYKIAIPTSHPPGLYWYHSHAHAESERQNLSGMSGAIVIEGIAKYTPQITNMPERILIVRDRPPAGIALPAGDLSQLEAMRWGMIHAPAANSDSMSGMAMPGMKQSDEIRGATNAQTRNPYVDVNPLFRTFARPEAADGHCAGTETPDKVWTVNGVSVPSIGIKPGEQQFWRLVNAGSDSYLDVQIDNAPMIIIALDGVPLISGINTPTSMTQTHYVVPPASRIEFIITGPKAGTKAYLRTNCFDAGPTGLAMPAAVLASLDPTASATVASRHLQRVPAQAKPFRFHTAAFIAAQAPSATQTLYYSEQLQMNGQSYNPSGPPMFYAQVGTTQDWTIVNTSTQVHTFHMHQIHFIVEAINGVAQAHQFVMDNVNIPPATTSGPGTVKVRLDFTDPLIVGTFLVHCHILSHEDAGMMAKIRVGTAAPIAVSKSTLTFASATAPSQTITLAGGKAPYSPSGCAGVAKASIGGSTVSVAPAGSGDCLLTIEDATGLTANVSIAVTAAKSPISLSSSTASFTSATAAAQTIVISGGTVPYTASGCAGVASEAVGGSKLTVAPKGVGTCTIAISDARNNTASVAVTVNEPSTGSSVDNLTFHQDALRTGWDQHETTLTTANVGSASFTRLTSLTAPSGQTGFGKVYGQPLYVTNEATSDGKRHNLVVISTSSDQVYAYDDQTYQLVWHRSFISPPSVVQQAWSDTGCYSPGDVGITGTPVIDRGRDRLYAVVATKESGTFHLRIHAISLSSGAEAVNPTDINATVTLATGGTASVDPLWNLQRPALLESAGNIYVGLGSHCDWKANYIHGWMLAYSAATLQMTGNMFDLSNENDGSDYFLSSIWMSGYGPAADPQGNVYFATGNGPYDGGVNAFGMSVVKIAGTLSRAGGNVSTFSPWLEATESQSDADLGSGGVLLMPDQKGAYPHMIVAGGKCVTAGCEKFVLNRDKLGGRQNNEAGALWHGYTAGWMWGGPAYFADAGGVSHIVYGGGNGWDPLNTYNVNVAPTSLTIQSSQSAVGCLICSRGDPGGSLPVVSSNGTAAGSAIVWAVQTPGQSGGTMSLYAFNALNMSSTLFHGVAGSWGVPPGASEIPAAFVSPLIAAGKVYVPVDGAVTVFGLKNGGSATRNAAREAVPPASVQRAEPALAPVDGERVIYGTIAQKTGDVLTVTLRDGRQLRVDAKDAVRAGTYAAPLYVGKTISARGVYAPDGTLDAATISNLGRADATAPADH